MFKIFQALSLIFFFLTLTSCEPKKEISEKFQTQARMKTAKGDIVFIFKPEVAPATVSRIKKLIENGFYNGLRFHRVVKNFIIQTGDPTGTGRGGSGQRLKPEISNLPQKRGTISMARSEDINSADSQFFITLERFPELDGKYTIFAEVIEGMEVADKVVEGDKILSLTLQTKPLKSN